MLRTAARSRTRWVTPSRKLMLHLSCKGKLSTTAAQDLSDPLRILFCGADSFSAVSLKALYTESTRPGSNILSIDVLAKNDKYSGRGLKQLKPPLIKRVAEELRLPVHQIDTFTRWSLPTYGDSTCPNINLIIAVSFGLLIPPRILASCKYGGLNVHPSMLPQLRGAAPLQWTIMNGLTHTGVSIQTLHPSRFDEGIILDQTPFPGLAIPEPIQIDFYQLRALLAPIGAEMLVNAVQNQIYKPPLKPVETVATNTDSALELAHAPKIFKSTQMVDFQKASLEQILRMNRAIPMLWAMAISRQGATRRQRIIMGTDMRSANSDDLEVALPPGLEEEIEVGRPFAMVREGEELHKSSAHLLIKTISNSFLAVPTLTVSGSPQGPAVAAAAKGCLFANHVIEFDGHELHVFHEPLSVPETPAETGI